MKFFESLQYEVENTPEVYYELSMEKGGGEMDFLFYHQPKTG